jgi:hypothetical protein
MEALITKRTRFVYPLIPGTNLLPKLWTIDGSAPIQLGIREQANSAGFAEFNVQRRSQDIGDEAICAHDVQRRLSPLSLGRVWDGLKPQRGLGSQPGVSIPGTLRPDDAP